MDYVISIIMWITLAVVCGFLSYCSSWNYRMNITIVSQQVMDTPWNAIRGTVPFLNIIIFLVAAILCLIKVAVMLGFVKMAS